MHSLINRSRPTAFCSGCSHNFTLKALDKAFQKLGLKESEAAIVTDIGCAGLFDTFFNTHAMHGLHGRALTYAAGIKLSQPQLKVLAVMGDGGLGIGAGHLLAACRRNLDLTLLILNNFNFGMTGVQFSCTTPSNASVTSGFLNFLERPMDVCSIAATAGAPFVVRASAFNKGLFKLLSEAISFKGFSIVDIWGPCTGRYTKRNPMSAPEIDAAIEKLPAFQGPVPDNIRREYGDYYREESVKERENTAWEDIKKIYEPPSKRRLEILLMGRAGLGVISTGSLLAHAVTLAGMHATQKNFYDITVMRGPSIAELIISPKQIGYTAIENPDIIVVISQEGVIRHQDIFGKMNSEGIVLLAEDVKIPAHSGHVHKIDFNAHKIKKKNRALFALCLLSKICESVTQDMLESAFIQKLKGQRLTEAIEIMKYARGQVIETII